MSLCPGGWSGVMHAAWGAGAGVAWNQCRVSCPKLPSLQHGERAVLAGEGLTETDLLPGEISGVRLLPVAGGPEKSLVWLLPPDTHTHTLSLYAGAHARGWGHSGMLAPPAGWGAGEVGSPYVE